jgi:5-methylcytosine-specific restriction protein A
MNRTRGRKWTAIREQIRAWNPYCVECLKNKVYKLFDEVDHIIPLHKGGTDDFSNLRGLCTEHHYQKTCKDQGKNYRSKVGVDGLPTDPNHPWNR